MSTNAKMARVLDGPSQQSLFGGGVNTTVPPVARPVIVITRGRIETAVRCPGCHEWHRHVGFGERHGPCGAVYRVQPRRGRAAA